MNNTNFSIFVCPKCGMVSVLDGSCRFCGTVKVDTGKTVLSASSQGFTESIHSIRHKIKSGSLYDRKAWRMREKLIRKELLAQARTNTTTPSYSEKSKFIECITSVHSDLAIAESTHINYGLAFAVFNTFKSIKAADNALSQYITAYTEIGTSILHSDRASDVKRISLKYLINDFASFLKSQYLAGQQEGIDACKIFLNETYDIILDSNQLLQF